MELFLHRTLPQVDNLAQQKKELVEQKKHALTVSISPQIAASRKSLGVFFQFVSVLPSIDDSIRNILTGYRLSKILSKASFFLVSSMVFQIYFRNVVSISEPATIDAGNGRLASGANRVAIDSRNNGSSRRCMTIARLRYNGRAGAWVSRGRPLAIIGGRPHSSEDRP